jgi:hypothetical protein
MEAVEFENRRSALLKKYNSQVGDKGAYIVSTKPYVSTLPLQWDIVDRDITNQFAFAVCRRGQNLDFFSYGIGEQLPIGPAGVTRKATNSDTNISKSKQTNGNADFVVEGLGLSMGATRYQDADVTSGVLVPFPAVTDPDVVAALQGERPMADPASIVMPPQAYSPFNLEQVLLQAVLRSSSFQFLWDEDRTEKLGPITRLAQGGGGSQLRSNGMPMPSNIFRVEEGYLWARIGEQDAEMVVRLAVDEAVIVPITLNNDPADDTKIIAPSFLFTDLALSLHGFEFKYPSRN